MVFQRCHLVCRAQLCWCWVPVLAQASAFFPIMRLHGHRLGGPPTNECGDTGGDNEIWNLAADQAHYDAMAAVLSLRTTLRDYTLYINGLTVATGLPMVRAMVLAFPGDAAAAAADGQWYAHRRFAVTVVANASHQTVILFCCLRLRRMYGPDFLVAPVTQQGAQSWNVYLPQLSNGTSWTYYWNSSNAGSGGHWATVDVSSMSDFPLFVRTPSLAWRAALRHGSDA